MRQWRVLVLASFVGAIILSGCGQLPPPAMQTESGTSDPPTSSLLQGALLGTGETVTLAPATGGISTQSIDAAAAKEGPLAKVGGTLAELYWAATEPGTISTRSLDAVPTVVTVDAVAVDDPDALLAQLQALGLRNGAAFGRVVSGRIPVTAIADAAALAGLLQMRPALAMTDVGLVTSEADRTVRTDQVRERLGFDGTGVTVGILSDSFARINPLDCPASPIQGVRQDDGSYVAATYATDVTSGDLPADVNILDDSAECEAQGDLIDEGRAMAQLVYDLAPGADLAFHTAFNGQADFAQGILDLADAGSDVIVDDIIYFFEPMFQDGIIAQAVDQVAAAGVPYFSSAGNRSDQSYESPFRDSGVTIPGVGTLHDWDPGPGTQLCQTFTLQAGQTFLPVLQWDEPFASASPASPGSASDVDMYLTFGDCTPITGFASILPNIGGDPVEFTGVSVGSPFTLGLTIALYDGPAPGLLKYVNFGTAGVAFDPPLDAPTSYGHNNAANGRGVAAAFYADAPAFGSRPTLESFSSFGGIPTLFDVDGNRLPTPVVRQQPDMTAPDGTNTTFFFSDTNRDDDDGDGVFETREVGEFPNFFGTSAAAPHAAAVAALLLQADPTLTVNEVYGIMERSAQNIGPKRVDYESGWGLINAYTALRRTVGNGR